MGVSGVGKSWLLDLSMRGLAGWHRAYVPAMLEKESQRVSRCPAEKLDTPLRRTVRQYVSEELHEKASSSRRGIVCEGHMAHVPAGDEGKFTEIAFTDHDKTLFNEVVLLEASPDVIDHRRRARLPWESHEGRSLSDIREEVALERARAIDLCRETGARLRVVDADFPDRALAVLRGYFRNAASTAETYPMSHRRTLIRHATRFGKEAKGMPVFLFDADGTLADVDVSTEFMKLLDEGALPATATMLANFRERGRSFASYIYHELYHRQFSADRFPEVCDKVAAKVDLFEGVKECLLEALKVGRVAILTAGVPEIWEAVLRRNGIEGVAIFGLVDKKARLVMDEQGKQCFAATVKKYASRLIAVGDSVIDLGMMREADAAFMIAGSGYKRLEPDGPLFESSEISKMYMMLADHPRCRRIKRNENDPLTTGPREAKWKDLVKISLRP